MRVFVKVWEQLVFKSKMTKRLAVFDFDHTIIIDNSDVVVMNLIDSSRIPKEVKQLHKKDGWTAFMQGVFDTLHKYNIDEEIIYNTIRQMPVVPGMIELIKELNENMLFDVIVISDSNSYFIEKWLDANDLNRNVKKVFTNPAHFEKGRLQIQMYHFQDTCKLSTKNLCKGQIMQEFIEQRNKSLEAPYEKVIYCGDGFNDFCPILRLQSGDLACVRENFKCVGLVQKSKQGQYFDHDGKQLIVQSDVCIWKNGFDILDYIINKKKI